MIAKVAERKQKQVDRIRTAVAAVEPSLADYARRHGGRFVVFGSAARGDLHHDSDYDLMVDFALPIEREARDFAERLCIDAGLRPDVHLKLDLSAALLERIVRDGRVLK
ncbi:MAG: nucleotidyltransferase family protein [Mesorhizobium sp.]